MVARTRHHIERTTSTVAHDRLDGKSRSSIANVHPVGECGETMRPDNKEDGHTSSSNMKSCVVLDARRPQGIRLIYEYDDADPSGLKRICASDNIPLPPAFNSLPISPRRRCDDRAKSRMQTSSFCSHCSNFHGVS